MDFSDLIGTIKNSISDLIDLREDSFKSKREFLARFEKSAAWDGDDWTFWDFIAAPKELAELKSQSLSYKAIARRCDDWMAKNERSKTSLIREIETGPHEGMAERLREMVNLGADPNAASLLKDTALGTARYHGYNDVFDLLIELGADGQKAGFSNLHHAVRYGCLLDVERLIETFDPLETYITAPSVLWEAVISEKTDVLTALLSHIEAENRLDDEEVETCFGLAVGTANQELVQPFIKLGLTCEIALDSTLEKYDVSMLKMLIEQGADVHQISDVALYTNKPWTILDSEGEPAIRAYINAMLDAGWVIDNLDDFEHEQVRYFTEAYLLPEQDVTLPNFTDGAGEVRGTSNPEERTKPFYLEMLRTGEWSSLMQSRIKNLPDVIWTAHRFGQSTTRLEDGRWVQIGGEHEDGYMREFVIFNDVVVHTPGGSPRVFFYPTSTFPPTDFHTATLVGDSIWIIGGLGYAGERQFGKTAVYRLDLNDFSIHKVETSGEFPGWINRHQATLKKDGICISGGKIEPGYKDSNASFLLNFDTLVWEKQSSRSHS
ncbi:hypothetical protein [Parasulfitobacter algicola]|uniref:Ankyrin n=1 Tax=Parasulfitobacter algicola TaxID=2614809 RepID=A0ABX2IVL2_9RHOB|nr:hypothetical protein [Sulfitobacter algicola]NSX56971.1 hypothetical protein [Sulfitobacter algicola]